MEKYIVNDKEYEVIKLLGKGKGGYSYLAKCDNQLVCLKKIHHEPCSYYTFGNKIQSEINDYQILLKTGINIPMMIDVDVDQEIIIKKLIEGPTIFDLVKEGKDVSKYIEQCFKMQEILKAFDLNIDYFPTNFLIKNDEIVYVDFECNKYMEEWNFNNWGIKYWSKTKEFIDYLNNH